MASADIGAESSIPMDWETSTPPAAFATALILRPAPAGVASATVPLRGMIRSMDSTVISAANSTCNAFNPLAIA